MLSLLSKKILVLGYGAVSKCVLHEIFSFFNVTPSQMYVVDKSNVFSNHEFHTFVETMDSISFPLFCDKIKLIESDIVIDLTFSSSTYAFIRTCLERGLFYVNTSIEDNSDPFSGQSIALQQQTVHSIYNEFCKYNRVRSSILTECGQNPGLIQHYVLYALNQLQKNESGVDDYRHDTLVSMIDKYQIGSILMSEIDGMNTDRPLEDKMYNTWSVAGFIVESMDKTEVVRGTENAYIQPTITPSMLSPAMTELFEQYQVAGNQVLFLNQRGFNTTLPSVAPIPAPNNQVVYQPFRGKLIHHGEVFELARYFGSKAPFMSYVYQNSPYTDKSIQMYMDRHKCTEDELMNYIKNKPDSFCVFDNINVPEHHRMNGFDSIGCTMFCGTTNIDRIFWCGSILEHTDPRIHPNFTPTITQVAAGVLSGLSYILEKDTPFGMYEPCDLDTEYMLRKSKPMLGRLSMMEIPKHHLSTLDIEFS